jgi:hypothetical protein
MCARPERMRYHHHFAESAGHKEIGSILYPPCRPDTNNSYPDKI